MTMGMPVTCFFLPGKVCGDCRVEAVYVFV